MSGLCQGETESQSSSKHPVSGGAADAPPNSRVDDDVLSWRFPDEADEGGIIRSVLFNVFFINFSFLMMGSFVIIF